MSNSNDSKLEIPKYLARPVRGQFDGIKFLWNTPEIQFFLKLIMTLLISMTITYSILYLIVSLYGRSESKLVYMFMGYFFYIFFGFLIYIIIELTLFYLSCRKNKEFPERNTKLSLKYWPFTESKRKSHITILIICIIFTILFQENDIYLFIIFHNPLFIPSFYFINFLDYFCLFIFGILAFFAIKGSFEKYEEKYSDKFQANAKWFYIAFLIPWILFAFVRYYAFKGVFRGNFTLAFFYFISPCFGVLGLLVLFKKGWRVGYTISMVSVAITFTFVILIPLFISLALEFLGIVVSFIAFLYFFTQGTLDKYGDELKQYHSSWDKKLERFNIKSEDDFKNQNYDNSFNKIPLESNVLNAYPHVILGLMLITLTLYGINDLIGEFFVYGGSKLGMETIESYLNVASAIESSGYALASVIFVIVIIKRQAKKFSDLKKKKSDSDQSQREQVMGISYQKCPNCNLMVKSANFCENCGIKLQLREK